MNYLTKYKIKNSYKYEIQNEKTLKKKSIL